MNQAAANSVNSRNSGAWKVGQVVFNVKLAVNDADVNVKVSSSTVFRPAQTEQLVFPPPNLPKVSIARFCP